MIIPEILGYLEEADLEDWLTAAFIEKESQLPLDQLCTDGAYRSPGRTPDIWMVELTNRTGKLWKGRFNVEFSEERHAREGVLRLSVEQGLRPRRWPRRGRFADEVDPEGTEELGL